MDVIIVIGAIIFVLIIIGAIAEKTEKNKHLKSYPPARKTEKNKHLELYPPIHNYEHLPRLREPAGYVYVIRDRNSRNYKIGYTRRNPKYRIEELSVTMSGELRNLEYVHIIKTNDAERTEKYWHDQFNNVRIRPDWEWFRLNGSQLQQICTVDGET